MQKIGFLKSAIYIGIPVFLFGYGIQKIVHYYEPSLLPMKLNYFMAGILVFHFLKTKSTKRYRVALALCAIFLASLDFRYGKQNIFLPFLVFSMLILGWLETTRQTPRLISSFINCRLTRFASDASYSVYLFHGFFISASGLLLSSHAKLQALLPYQRVLFMFLFVSISAYLTAYIVHRFIEQPGIRFGKQMIERLAPITIRQSSDAT